MGGVSQSRCRPKQRTSTSRTDSRRQFIDAARIVVRAGQGGKGSASFRREPFTPRGGPDGGDGGRGGSVVMRATTEVSDLSAYKTRSRWTAEPGADGAGGRKTGRGGADILLDVPVGTVVLDEKGELVADLDRAGADAVVAHGGTGGRGNQSGEQPHDQQHDQQLNQREAQNRSLTPIFKGSRNRYRHRCPRRPARRRRPC